MGTSKKRQSAKAAQPKAKKPAPLTRSQHTARQLHPAPTPEGLPGISRGVGSVKFTEPVRAVYLAMLAGTHPNEHGVCEIHTKASACHALGIARNLVGAYRQAHPEFELEEEDAYRAGGEMLEREALRRAHQGTDEPVLYQGEFQYDVDEKTGEKRLRTVNKKSDILLMFNMKARDARFKDKLAVEGNLGVSFAGLARMAMKGGDNDA